MDIGGRGLLFIKAALAPDFSRDVLLAKLTALAKSVQNPPHPPKPLKRGDRDLKLEEMLN